jgi:hypothetical protein
VASATATRHEGETHPKNRAKAAKGMNQRRSALAELRICSLRSPKCSAGVGKPQQHLRGCTRELDFRFERALPARGFSCHRLL